jgi:uncharacterized protein YjiS (DUF1127 family)
MSCGSTICTSTSYDIPASNPSAGFNWLWRRPSVWLAKIADGCERSYQRRQLLELDNRLLADIGLSRDDAVEEVCKSSWIHLTMWRLQR